MNKDWSDIGDQLGRACERNTLVPRRKYPGTNRNRALEDTPKTARSLIRRSRVKISFGMETCRYALTKGVIIPWPSSHTEQHGSYK